MTDRPMFSKVLVANRGEVALRIVRALHDLGLPSVAVYADDDAASPHVDAADEAVALNATGPAAYLDGARLIAIAQAQGCDAVHPGYGFLSERADFARACAAAGLRFIGPTPEQLALFGDKAQARALALRCGVPLMPGTQAAVTLEEAQAFWQAQGGAGIVIKAIGGGGGRGMRAVQSLDDLPDAYARCRSEALAAFGVDGVYVERLMRNARHIEVQVLGDGREVMALGERECTVQRRFQKVVEIAPSPSLPAALRDHITAAALAMAREVAYEGLGTFEFLVDLTSNDLPFVFIECNPRLQVEHTITEEVTGVDLVQTQIALAAGRSCATWASTPPHRLPCRALPCSGASTPKRWMRWAARCLAAARSAASICLLAPAFAWTRMAQPVPRRRRTTTPCSPSSSCTRAARVLPTCCAARSARWPSAASRVWPPTSRCCRRWPRGLRWPASRCTRAGWSRCFLLCWRFQKT